MKTDRARTYVLLLTGWKHRGKIGWIHGHLNTMNPLVSKVHVHIDGEPHTISVAIKALREITEQERHLLTSGAEARRVYT